MNYNLLNRDTRTFTQKFKDKMDHLKSEKEKDKFNEDKSVDKSTSTNSNIRDDLSKVGLSNTLMGTKQVINNQNKILKENSMGKIIPIKQIILEFTADHMREHAGKYSAGTMLGLGALAGHLASGGDTGGLVDKVNTSVGNSIDNRSDFQKDLGDASETKHTSYHNRNKGIIDNGIDAIKHFTGNLRAENKFNDMAQAQEEYNNIKNSDGSLLTAGQMAGIGATVGGAGLLASRLKRRK